MAREAARRGAAAARPCARGRRPPSPASSRGGGRRRPRAGPRPDRSFPALEPLQRSRQRRRLRRQRGEEEEEEQQEEEATPLSLVPSRRRPGRRRRRPFLTTTTVAATTTTTIAAASPRSPRAPLPFLSELSRPRAPISTPVHPRRQRAPALARGEEEEMGLALVAFFLGQAKRSECFHSPKIFPSFLWRACLERKERWRRLPQMTATFSPRSPWTATFSPRSPWTATSPLRAPRPGAARRASWRWRSADQRRPWHHHRWVLLPLRSRRQGHLLPLPRPRWHCLIWRDHR